MLIPTTVFIGVLLGIGLMSGAILSHFTIIGIQSKGDGGQLFMLAIAVWICCAILLLLHKHSAIVFLKSFKKQSVSPLRN